MTHNSNTPTRTPGFTFSVLVSNTNLEKFILQIIVTEDLQRDCLLRKHILENDHILLMSSAYNENKHSILNQKVKKLRTLLRAQIKK